MLHGTIKRLTQTAREALSPMWEMLEGRTLLSATALTVHAAVKKITAPTPAVVADPAVTDPSITYQSFAGDPLFAPAGPTDADINQGDVGDCFFLAALAAVAKVDPKLIKSDIAANTDGTFTVKLFSGKTQESVRLDASLPVFSDGAPAYADLGNDNSLWVAMMEKAYAVVRTGADSYDSLNGGWMGDAFNALGIRNVSVMEASVAALGKSLATDLKAKDAITLGTNNTIVDGADLIGGHGYEVESATFAKNGTLVSVTVRNPWGEAAENDGVVTLTAQQVLDNMIALSVGVA